MCEHCPSHLSKFQCGACSVLYCSEQCAVNHWDNGHKFECIGPRGKQGREDRTDEEDENEVTLVSSDGTKFQIQYKFVKKSKTLREEIADNGADAPISQPNIPSNVLGQIVTFLKFDNIPILLNLQDTKNFLNACDYLDIKNTPFDLLKEHEREITGFFPKLIDKWSKDGGLNSERYFTLFKALQLRDQTGEFIYRTDMEDMEGVFYPANSMLKLIPFQRNGRKYRYKVNDVIDQMLFEYETFERLEIRRAQKQETGEGVRQNRSSKQQKIKDEIANFEEERKKFKDFLQLAPVFDTFFRLISELDEDYFNIIYRVAYDKEGNWNKTLRSMVDIIKQKIDSGIVNASPELLQAIEEVEWFV